jgi:hypothetical protein
MVLSAAKKQNNGSDFLGDYIHISRRPRAAIQAIFDFIVELPPVAEPGMPMNAHLLERYLG